MSASRRRSATVTEKIAEFHAALPPLPRSVAKWLRVTTRPRRIAVVRDRPASVVGLRLRRLWRPGNGFAYVELEGNTLRDYKLYSVKSSYHLRPMRVETSIPVDACWRCKRAYKHWWARSAWKRVPKRWQKAWLCLDCFREVT